MDGKKIMIKQWQISHEKKSFNKIFNISSSLNGTPIQPVDYCKDKSF